jgi:O-antigen/teichoic acid export membrane protein
MTETAERTGTGGVGAAAAAVGIAAVAVNAMAYVVPFLSARLLTPADLGALAAALALAAIASVAGLGLQTAVAVRRAKRGEVRAGRVTALTAGIVVGALLVATPVLSPVLNLSPLIPPVIGVTIAAFVVACRYLGELQGAQRFRGMAWGMVVMALGRYGGVIAGLVAGVGVVGSLALGAVASLLTLPWLARLARSAHHGTAAAAPDDLAPLGRGVLSASTATLAMLTVSYADLILARIFLSAADSGSYAVGSVLTKGALWAPAVVSLIALPRLARGSVRTLRLSTIALAASGAVLVLGAALLNDLAITLAGGPGYRTLAPYAPLFTAVGALYALAFLFVNARIAAGARWPSAPLWAGTAALLTAVALSGPPTIGRIVTCAAATAIGTTAVMGVLAIRRRPTTG